MQPSVGVFVAVLAAFVLGFAQLGGVFDGDEGLHLIAIALTRTGQHPYADFYYWHEPLYLYLAAAWSLIGGVGWRSIHLLSSLLTVVSVSLVALLTLRLCADDDDRRSWAVAAAVCFALNLLVLKWGTAAHNYAPALLCMLAAIHATLRAADRPGNRAAFAAGLCAGGATAFTLLTLPVLPVAILWLAKHNGAGAARTKLPAMFAGGVVPFAPLAWLAWNAPSQTMFGLVTHHLYYRQGAAETSTAYLWELAGDASRSPQAWLLGLLTVVALAVAKRTVASPVDRRAWSLVTWLGFALTVFVVTIRPPVHAVYFVVVTPYLAMLAALGARAAAAHLGMRRSRAAAALLAAAFIAACVVGVYQQRLWRSEWARIEQLGRAVSDVTPNDATLYSSNWFVYSAAHRLPPEGAENVPASIDLPLSDEMFRVLGLMPATELDAQVSRGEFDTLLLWTGDPRFDEVSLDQRYQHRRNFDRFVLRWGRVR